MNEIFFKLRTKQISTKDVCGLINNNLDKNLETTCSRYEGGGFWVESKNDITDLQKIIENKFNIELDMSKPRSVGGYEVKKEKDGFNICWELPIETSNMFYERFNQKIKVLSCHISIWSKIFYTKHKSSTWNNRYSENIILQELPEYIEKIIKQNSILNDNTKDINRYVFIDKFLVSDEREVWYYIIIQFVKNGRAKIISIYRKK